MAALAPEISESLMHKGPSPLGQEICEDGRSFNVPGFPQSAGSEPLLVTSHFPGIQQRTPVINEPWAFKVHPYYDGLSLIQSESCGVLDEDFLEIDAEFDADS
jgi:hypothetical protein